MRSPISRKFTLVFMIFGLAILCSGCVNSTASSALTTNIPISNKKVLFTPTPQIRINEHSTAMPSHRTLPHRVSLAVSPQSTLAAPARSHQSLRLLLACSGPTARDGFSATYTHARACVYTAPGATLTISVHFCGGKADPSSILQRNAIAGVGGFYEWDWAPIADCNGGRVWGWNVKVTAQMQEINASVSEASSTQSAISTSSSSSSSASSNP
jgi:hypothetical protein